MISEKKIGVFVLMVIAVCVIFLVWDNRNMIKPEEVRTFNLVTGESLTIKIAENGSTGYVNCWLNKSQCNNVKLSNVDYKQGINSRMGMIGSGGWKYYKFTSIKQGSDTIKIHNCPVKNYPSGCEAFEDEIDNIDYIIIIHCE